MENRPKVSVPIKDLESYPNASMSAKSEENNREKPAPVVSKSDVTMRKRSAWKNVKHRIFEEEGAEIKNHVFGNIIFPALKDMVGSAIVDALDIMLWGEPHHTARGRSNIVGGTRYGNYVSYNSFSSNNARTGPNSRVVNNSGYRNYMDMDDIYFETESKAYNLLSSMRAIIDRYHVISVADMYGLISEVGPDGVERPMVAPWTYNNYGWYDLSTTTIKGDRYGFRLVLPAPKRIN